jgi:hypothetical protein
MENPESQSVRLSLARSSTTSPDTLAKLAEWLGKGAILYNSDTEAILCALAQNPNTPISILERFAQHPPFIHPEDGVPYMDRRGFGDPNSYLFVCVARNPNASELVLFQLARSSSVNNYPMFGRPSESLRCAITAHPKVSVMLLNKLKNHTVW